MVERKALLWTILALAPVMISCIVIPFASETPTLAREPVPTVASEPLSTATVSAGTPDEEDVMAVLSLDSLLGYVEALTEIQVYSGWRNSATSGEEEAVNYVNGMLDSFTTLKEMGMTVEREDFRVFMATEVWQAELRIRLDGEQHDIPVSPPRGPRDNVEIASSFDSDGRLGDEELNPLVVSGEVLFINTDDRLWSLSEEEARDKVILLNYALVDRTMLSGYEAETRAAHLIEAQPLALVLVTSWSPHPGESHGSFAYEGGPFDWVNDNGTPIVVARLEDMADAGIGDFVDLEPVSEATVLLDTDVISPARSRNLIAMIPGRDDSQALILGAHIDSPNNPGAMDDGSGSAILLEMARVLNESGYQPGVTIYLVWFGSEELFLYGSNTFAARHQDLLDRTIAMMQIDCLTRPLDGLTGIMAFAYWSYARYGEASYPLNDFLEEEADNLGILAHGEDELGVVSDNGSFSGFDVPNADLIYWVIEEAEAGGIHNAGVIHAPYDTLERVKESSDAFMEMAQIALRATVWLGEDRPKLRPTRPDEGRAVFVGTQTEAVYMTPAALTDFAMALEFSGLDVDLIPYGATLSAEDLEGANIVFALPTIDYPSREAGSLTWYDVEWEDEEIEIFREYVEEGGLLVIVNSRYRLKYGYPAMDENEDWADMNALAEVFGITFHDATTWGTLASTGHHPLTQGQRDISLAESNGVLFSYETGETLADFLGDAVMALVPYGNAGGEVLVIGDLGILRTAWGEAVPHNLQLWLNLAEYATGR
jgi:hypothetical protein